MIDQSIVIVLPMPARVLQPNCTIATIGGRMAKASASKRFRRLACEAIEAERLEDLPWRKVSVAATFFYKTNRRRDTDNAIGSLKAIYDGIVDSGLIKDDTPEYMERQNPVFDVDKACPRVVLTIAKLQ